MPKVTYTPSLPIEQVVLTNFVNSLNASACSLAEAFFCIRANRRPAKFVRLQSRAFSRLIAHRAPCSRTTPQCHLPDVRLPGDGIGWQDSPPRARSAHLALAGAPNRQRLSFPAKIEARPPHFAESEHLFRKFRHMPTAAYISFLNSAFRSSTLVCFGLPGAQASAKADSARNCKSSSFSAGSLVGMPTSMDNWRTASIAALR